MFRSGGIVLRPRLAALILTAVPSVALAGGFDVRCAWPGSTTPAVLPASTEVEVTPVVADLDGDGMPEIVVVTFVDGSDDNGGVDGVIRILSGRDCSEIATMVDPGCVTCTGDIACGSLDEQADAGVFCPACGVAVADLDNDGQLEIIAFTEGDGSPGAGRRVVILDSRGQFVRCSARPAGRIGYLAHPSIADVDADGIPEVIAQSNVIRADGSVMWETPTAGVGLGFAADLDADTLPEVVLGERVLRNDGSELWTRDDLRPAFPAVADFNLDCVPEIVTVAPKLARLSILDSATGATIATALLPGGTDACPPRPDQGGFPSLADIDGDCVPEIGVAGCLQYSMYRFVDDGVSAQLVEMWSVPTLDFSSRVTGSSMFDLEGDGRIEVLYNDHEKLRAFDALTGAISREVGNTTFTLVENPTVADADADGHADVIVGANKYAICCDTGVRVFHDATTPWAPTRTIYNQHAYHVTNINDDGSVPAVAEPSWRRHQSFRSQTQATREIAPPTISGVPPDAVAECTPPPPARPVASGPCSDEPVLELVETTEPGGCADTYRLVRTWTATDRCGESTQSRQVISISDTLLPSLVGVPADITVSCGRVPAAPAVTATDTCDPAPLVTMVETEVPGTCPDELTLRRTWTARDRCGNALSAEQVITVRDDAAPVLDGVPADVTVTCGRVPAAPAVTATDTCDPAPTVTMSESETPGRCPDELTIRRTWLASDRCGNSAVRTQLITVVDDVAPALDGVPADVVLECGDVVPTPSVTARDTCDPAPTVTFDETRIDGDCPGEYELLRTWRARDRCGNAFAASQRVTVRDTTPPSVRLSADAIACLWPPNHWYVCLGPADVAPVIADACPGAVSWLFAGCASDQPDDARETDRTSGWNGDGHTTEDCMVAADGSGICVRSERCGTGPTAQDGRHYGVAIIAIDACGNATPPQVIGTLYVPHDQSPHERDCLNPTAIGIKPNGSPASNRRGGK